MADNQFIIDVPADSSLTLAQKRAAIGKVLFGFLTRRQRAGSTEAAAA